MQLDVVGGRAEVALPDRRPGLRVGGTDRNDVVEPAGAQERRIEGADGVGGADQQAVVLVAETGDQLEQFVGDSVAWIDGLTGPDASDLLDFVDEQQDGFQLRQIGERVPQ